MNEVMTTPTNANFYSQELPGATNGDANTASRQQNQLQTLNKQHLTEHLQLGVSNPTPAQSSDVITQLLKSNGNQIQSSAGIGVGIGAGVGAGVHVLVVLVVVVLRLRCLTNNMRYLINNR